MKSFRTAIVLLLSCVMCLYGASTYALAVEDALPDVGAADIADTPLELPDTAIAWTKAQNASSDQDGTARLSWTIPVTTTRSGNATHETTEVAFVPLTEEAATILEDNVYALLHQ